MIKSGNFSGQKTRYPEITEKSIPSAVWCLLKNDKSDMAFDFRFEDREDVAKVIAGLETDVEEVCVPDLEYEKYKKKLNERKKKWWYKAHKAIEDIGIQIVPFDWQCRAFLITRPISGGTETMLRKCSGFHFGPIVVTW